MNKLTIIGNLTANPESRYVDTVNGSQTVCSFSVAVNRSVRGQKVTDYFRVSCWNKQAENAMKYLQRGSKVAVVGPVTAHAYAAQDNTLRASMEITATEIEYLSGSGGNAQTSGQQGYSGQPQSGQAMPPQNAVLPNQDAANEGFMQIPPDINDEELPFG